MVQLQFMTELSKKTLKKVLTCSENNDTMNIQDEK